MHTKQRVKHRAAGALGSVCFAALMAFPAAAQDGSASAPPQAPENGGDIVVTARLRGEKLMDVPVAVSALSAADLQKSNASDLTKIGELTPTVIISNYKVNGGGSIAIRGISSSPGQIGFEQAVSVAIDGVQTSTGRVAMLGFFDLQQVEVMKGPQALFFGKNSPAGVISLTSAGPTREFEAGIRAGYELVGNEKTIEGYVSGPLTDTLGLRVAGKYRDLDGWLHNNARSAPNPFYTAAQPASAAVVPGRAKKNIGDNDLLGRVTLRYEPDAAFDAELKLFGYRGKDQGAGAYSQNIGPRTGGLPRSFGVADPNGDCKLDNQTSYGAIAQGVAAGFPRSGGNGTPRGLVHAYVGSLTLHADLEKVKLTSITGYIHYDYFNISALDQTVYGGLIVLDDSKLNSFSQEIRAATNLDGPLNFLVGGYFQSSKDSVYNDVGIRNDISFNPANGRYDSYEKIATLKGRTYSLFGQATWQVIDNLELTGGARWTRERKKTRNQNIYGRTNGVGAFNTSNVVFADSSDQTPGILAGTFSDSNVSPEATISWHPDRNSTIYASYKTGYKSGGFGLTSPISASTTLADIDFESEKVKGFEIGAKGELFNRKLRLTSALFFYDYRNLQVTTYDAPLVRYVIDNAGKVQQRGIEVEGEYRVTPQFKLHGAVAYVHNRMENYVGQCYAYTVPAAAAQTATAPSGCSFVLNSSGGRLLTAAGAPVLQQVNDGRAPARSPDWSGNAGFDYTIPAGDDLEVGVSGDGFYSGSYYASENYSPISQQNAFWRFNASVRVGPADGRWQVSLIGRNLTNKYYLLYAADRTGGASIPLIPGEQRGVSARPREVSVQGSFRF